MFDSPAEPSSHSVLDENERSINYTMHTYALSMALTD